MFARALRRVAYVRTELKVEVAEESVGRPTVLVCQRDQKPGPPKNALGRKSKEAEEQSRSAWGVATAVNPWRL
jgi:hypothetical protein